MRSDADLLVAARTDARPFRELYERYAARVYGYHLKRSRDSEAAHDLTAETFAQAWLSRGRFRDEAGGSAGPWLFAIARHVLTASVRRRRIEQSACERLGLALSRENEVTAAVPEEAWLDDADEALADLSAAEREAVRLRVIDELGYEEVAGALGTTREAARVRVHRGLSKLRDRFSERTEAAR